MKQRCSWWWWKGQFWDFSCSFKLAYISAVPKHATVTAPSFMASCRSSAIACLFPGATILNCARSAWDLAWFKMSVPGIILWHAYEFAAVLCSTTVRSLGTTVKSWTQSRYFFHMWIILVTSCLWLTWRQARHLCNHAKCIDLICIEIIFPPAVPLKTVRQDRI